MHDAELIKVLDEILTHISIEIGERLTGSDNNRKVETYTKEYFENQGYAVELQEFPCSDFKYEGAELIFNNKKITAKPSYYTAKCDVSGEYVKVETIEELRDSVLSDKIAVLHGDLTNEQIMPKTFPFYNPEHHQEIIRLLEEKNPSAIIAVVENDESVFEDGDFLIPSVYISKKVGKALLENEGTLELAINVSRKESKGANVIARLNPQKKQKVVITAHMDTKSGTPGALDNATGIAILLLLSHLIKPEAIDFCLELLLLNGEDYYSIPGQRLYMDTYLKASENILLAINCDGVGLKDSPTTVTFIENEREIKSQLKESLLENNDLEFIDPWVQGDHMIFVMENIPVIAFTSKAIFQLLDTVIHTEKDTIDLIDFEKVIQVVRLLEESVKNYHKEEE